MAAIYPPVTVEAPPASQLRYGLFNAARVVEQPAIASIGGVQFQPTTCGGAHLYTAECPPSAQNIKPFDAATDTITTAPFWAIATVTCSPVGRDIEEQANRARQRLLSGEQTQVEAAFWNGGGVGAAPNLNGIGATVVPTALTTFGARLSALEAAFYAAYGRQGTIHVNTSAEGAAAFGSMLVRPDTPDIPTHLVTPIGSIWSFGAGYGITGPAGVAPAAGSVWAFITAPVTIWRDTEISMPDPFQTFNRSTNQAMVEASRAYNVAPDCATAFAIQLPLEAP